MDADLTAQIRAELDARAAQNTADWKRRRQATLELRAAKAARRKAGLTQRHAAKRARAA